MKHLDEDEDDCPLNIRTIFHFNLFPYQIVHPHLDLKQHKKCQNKRAKISEKKKRKKMSKYLTFILHTQLVSSF